MKSKLYLPALAFLFFYSCVEESPVENEDGNNNTPAVVIGTQGGTLEYENLSVSIPSGSFSANYEISISKDGNSNTGFQNVLSEVYIINGIPDDFKQPIEVKIKISSFSQAGTPAFAIGEEVFSKSGGAVSKRFYFTESQQDGDYLSAQLPVPEVSLGKEVKKTVQETTGITVMAAARVTSYTTSQGHFKIDVTGSPVSQPALETLGNYFEEAYNYYLELGFSYSKRTSWPVSITVKEMDNYGEYLNSVFGHNYGYIEFNHAAAVNAATDPETRRTAGHEFFHLVQSFYDPRNAFSRAKLSYDWYWLDEAAGTWSECKFTADSNYISGNTLLPDNRMRPLNGLHKGSDDNPRGHGYGMAPFINYLTETYGETILADIFEKILEGRSALDAVFDAANQKNDLVSDFFTGFITGEFKGSAGFISAYLSAENQHTINSLNDVPETFNLKLPDYGAEYVRVDVKNTDASNSQSLKASCNMPGVNIAAISNVSGATTLLSLGESEVTINNLKDLRDQNARIILLLIDLSPSAGYSGEKDAELTIDIEEAEFNTCYVNISFGVTGKNASKSDPSDVTTTVDFVDVGIFVERGMLNGNTFTAVIDSTNPATGFVLQQELNITFSDNFSNISSISVAENKGYPDFATFNYWIKTSVVLQDISGGLTIDNNYLYSIDGEPLCDHINSYSFIKEDAERIYTAESALCYSFSYARIEIIMGE